MVSSNTKQCSRCKEEKSIECFYIRRENRNGFARRSNCKDCHQNYRAANREQQRKRRAEWYLKNRNEIIAKTKAYAEAHSDKAKNYKRKYILANPDQRRIDVSRRRARKRGVACNDLTAAQWKEIKAAYKHCCAYCGQKCRLLTQDHIIPLSGGGQHTASNIAPACKSCNCKKGTGSVLRPVQPLLLTFS